MKEFSEQYNGFFGTVAMGGNHLWLGDMKIVHDLLAKRAPIYSSRPEVSAVPGSDSQGQYLPLLAHGDHWRRQRKFAHTVLTAAHSNQFYGYTTLEVKRLLAKLAQDPKDYYNTVDSYCGRITARLAYGRPDSAPNHCQNAREFIPHISLAGPITNRFPFLAKLPEWLNPSIKEVRLRRETEEKLWLGLMKDVEEEMATGTAAPVSYARTYLERRNADKLSKSDSKSTAFDFDDREAAYAVGMLCTVAIFTISGPLNTFLLALTLHPEWQDAVRKEVDTVLGDRLATLADSPNLPTLRAVIKECFRWKPPVPAGVPHLLEQDDVYNGYFIPKGTVVHACEQAISRDPALYPSPESFNPARWLSPEFPSYREPLTAHPTLVGHHQFGVGRRSCPGVDLTEAELLIACSAIVWAFTLRPKRAADGREILPETGPKSMTTNLIGGPLPFEFEMAVRSEERRAQVLHMWREEEAEAEGKASKY
jgi:cytochrome P450